MNFRARHPLQYSIVWNTASQILGKIINAGTSLLLAVAIAAWYGAFGFGEFTKITTFVALFYMLVDFGLNAVVLRHPKLPWRELLALRLLLGCFFTLFAAGLSWVLPATVFGGYSPLVRLGIFLVAPTILAQGLMTTANALFQKNLRYEYATYALAIGNLVTIGFLFLFRSSHMFWSGILMACIAMTMGTFAIAAASFFFAKKFSPSLMPKFTWSTMKQLFWEAFPLSITIGFNLVYIRADSIILTLLKSTQDVGVYGLAYRIFELPLVLPTFFMNAVYPVLITVESPFDAQGKGKWTVNNGKFFSVIKKASGMLFFLSMALTVCLWVSAPWISLIHEEFAASVPVLRVLVLGFPFFFLSSVTMWVLIALRKQNTLAWIYGVGMIGVIVANWLLIPGYGYMACAWITVLSEALILACSFLSIYHEVQRKGRGI